MRKAPQTQPIKTNTKPQVFNFDPKHYTRNSLKES